MPKKVYACPICDITTRNKTDYNKHLKTKKHKLNISRHNPFSETAPNRSLPLPTAHFVANPKVDEPTIFCQFCHARFNKVSNYNRHQKTCTEFTSLKAEHEKLKAELQKKEEAFQKRQETLHMEMKKHEEDKELMRQKYETDKEQLKSIIDTMNKQFFERMVYEKNQDMDRLALNNKATSSLFSAIQDQYRDAPPIQAIKGIEEVPKLKHVKETDQGDLKFCDSIREMKHKGQLAKYIGDILVSIYKKEDPQDQSMWSTDISRLNYAVRKIVDKVPEWQLDKKGVSITKEVIKPLVKQIDKLIVEGSKDYRQYIEDTHGPMTSIKYVSILSEAMDDMNSPKLHKAILKYVSPYFINQETTKKITYTKPKRKSKRSKISKPVYSESYSEQSEQDSEEVPDLSDTEVTITITRSIPADAEVDSNDDVTQSEYERIMEKCRTSYAEAMRGQPSRLFTTSGLDRKKRSSK